MKWGGACAAFAMVALWVASVWIDILWWSKSGLLVGMQRSRLSITQIPPWKDAETGWRVVSDELERKLPVQWEAMFHGTPRARSASIPIWQALLAVGLVAMIGWRMDAIAVRRVRKGLCCGCGYDLAGIAKGAKCPECGAM